MDESDLALWKRLEELISGGLTNERAVGFLASLSRAECDRLLALFAENSANALPPPMRTKLITIFQKLRDVKVK